MEPLLHHASYDYYENNRSEKNNFKTAIHIYSSVSYPYYQGYFYWPIRIDATGCLLSFLRRTPGAFLL